MPDIYLVVAKGTGLWVFIMHFALCPALIRVVRGEKGSKSLVFEILRPGFKRISWVKKFQDLFFRISSLTFSIVVSFKILFLSSI